MIRINLLPHREMRREKRKKEFVSLAGVIGAAGVATALAVGFGINSQIDAQTDRNNYIKAKNSELDSQIAEIANLEAEAIAGENESKSEILFKNIKLIYDLRSKIIHGTEFDDDLVSEYLKYLQNIVSKIIIELLIHGIENIETLNYKITKIGFGDRNKISNNWKEFAFNQNLEKIIQTELPKKIIEQ